MVETLIKDNAIPPAKIKRVNNKRKNNLFWGNFKKSAKDRRAERKQVSPVVMAKMITEVIVTVPPIGPKSPFAIWDTTPPVSTLLMAVNNEAELS